MKRSSASTLLIGAHTSAQGGAHHALLTGHAIGATTIQLFTSNQKQWKGRPISEEDAALFQSTRRDTDLQAIMSHDSYLINLGSSNKEVREKSRNAFKEELQRCHLLGVDFLNFHPGAAVDGTEKECLDLIIESLNELESFAKQGNTRLLIETTAGQGTCVGHRFEHLGYLIQHLHVPIGVCIDTCHIFAAGYDIRSAQGWQETLDAFDALVGLEHLYAFHVNDSLKPLGSRRDRHAPLGQGEIGLKCFEIMMTHPAMREIPKYLETPDGPPLWKKEIALLREFAS